MSINKKVITKAFKNREERILEFINNDVRFFNDCYKAVHGTKANVLVIDQFKSLSHEDKYIELKNLCKDIK